jgi:hypothetical protein
VSLPDRWRHVQAVGRKAERLSCTVADNDRELLVAAAWLHDIGYAPSLVYTGLHALDGARFLQRIGCDARLCALVAHHSGARFEAEERGLSDELAVFPLEDSPVMDALVVADFTTGPQGQDLDYDARVDEVLDRYEPSSPVHRAVTQGREQLRLHVERVSARLAQPT